MRRSHFKDLSSLCTGSSRMHRKLTKKVFANNFAEVIQIILFSSLHHFPSKSETMKASSRVGSSLFWERQVLWNVFTQHFCHNLINSHHSVTAHQHQLWFLQLELVWQCLLPDWWSESQEKSSFTDHHLSLDHYQSFQLRCKTQLSPVFTTVNPCFMTAATCLKWNIFLFCTVNIFLWCTVKYFSHLFNISGWRTEHLEWDWTWYTKIHHRHKW